MPITYTAVGLVSGVAVAFCPGNPLAKFTLHRPDTRAGLEPFNLDHLKYISSLLLSATVGSLCGVFLDILAENTNPVSAGVVLLIVLAVSGDTIARKIDESIESEAMAANSRRQIVCRNSGSDSEVEMQVLRTCLKS